MEEVIPLYVCAAFIISIPLRMAATKGWRVALIGIAGFLGGTYYEQFKVSQNFEVSAATSIVPAGDGSWPMDVDVPRNRTAEIMRFGFPGLDNIQSRKNFVLSYDPRNRVAHWVCEHLTKDSVRYEESVDRSKSEFFEDAAVHPYFRSKNSDYKYSGFDRGHLAAAGNHRSNQEHVDDSFVLSNIAPQVGKGFNRDSWNRLETYVRRLTKNYINVYVCTGPLYLPKMEADGKKYIKYQVIGTTNVAVPTHFFKVIIGETTDHKFDLESYVMPNAYIDDNVPLDNFLVPKDAIERSSGLLLFNKISLKGFRSINGARG